MNVILHISNPERDFPLITSLSEKRGWGVNLDVNYTQEPCVSEEQAPYFSAYDLDTLTRDAAEEATDFHNRLNSLADYQTGWDGEGKCQAVSSEALSVATAFTQSLSARRLNKWMVYPAANGSIVLMAKDRVVASFSIGIDGFSYIAKARGKPTTKGMSSLDPNLFRFLFNYITDFYLTQP